MKAKTSTTKSQTPKSKISNLKSEIKVDWSQLYLDLPENIAKILRDKRVKPKQLTAKEDGEILALGLSDTDLEIIRAKYPSTLADTTPPVIPTKHSVIPTEVEGSLDSARDDNDDNKEKSTSHFYQYPRRIHGRSARYKALVKKIDRSLTYAPQTALELLVATGGGGNKSLDLHVNTVETGLRGEVKVPFSTGKTIRIEIFSDKTVTALNNNEFNFDVLLATPADMPKLAKYAPVLGPKGLMPNPKNGTIVTDPAARAQSLSSGAAIAFKTEPKFPIIHLSLGKTSQKVDELAANLSAVLKEIGVAKIKSAYLTSNQGPSARLDLSAL